MKRHLPFSQQLKQERELHNWSQAELASMLGTDPKTVNRWETGKRMPRPYLRRLLCEIFGKSAYELGLLDDHINEDEKAPFDLDTISIKLGTEDHPSDEYILALTNAPQMRANDRHSRPTLREYWSEAPHIETFHGRHEELEMLRQWVVTLRSRIIVISGMGGIGKTALLTNFAENVKHSSFEYVFWQSLQNAPPLEYVLKKSLQFLSQQRSIDFPKQLDNQIDLLIQYLRNDHCLLVLDNFESLLQAGNSMGQFRVGYEGYEKLLRRIGEAQHESCLILTTRERPGEVARMEGRTSSVRSLLLTGVGVAEGQVLLKERGLFGSSDQWKELVDRYAGNPLALKLVSEYIEGLFKGDIALFLREEELAFGDINDLLDQQFDRLSQLEREILYWLAIEREATSLERIREDLVRSMAKGTVLELLNSLRHRSLIETNGPVRFSLQPVIMEYVTDSIIAQACQEFVGAEQLILTNYALIKADATEYVRESQLRLILHRIAEQLLNTLDKEEIEQKLRDIISTHRKMLSQRRGYLAGNVLNLMIYLQSNLREMDFSGLTVRQAYLQGASLPATNFAGSHFISSVFTNTFGNVLSVAFSPRGGILAAGTTTGDIWIYDTMMGIPLCICRGHTDGVWSISFSLDGQILVSSSDDQSIRLWDVRSGDCLNILEGHTNRVRSIAINVDGRILASGSDDGTLRIWDISTGHCLRTLHMLIEQKHVADFRVWSVAFSSDDNLLVGGNTEGTICLWDTRTWDCYERVYRHEGGVRSLAVSRDGSFVASGGNDQTVRLWHTGSGQCRQILQGHTNRVWSVAFNQDEQLLASSSEDGTIRLWDLSEGVCVKILQGHMQGVRSVAFCPDAPILASGGEDHTVRLWNIENGHSLRTLQGYTNCIWSIAFSPDGNVLASGCEDQTIRLWEVGTGVCTRIIQTGSHGVRTIAFCSDERILASGGEDQTIRLWSSSTGHCLQTLQGHMNWIWSVAISPDGKILASGSEDQTIRLWEVGTGQNLNTLRAHSSWVRSVAFSPDGKILASGSDDRTIRLWETLTGRCIAILKEHTDRIRSVDFSPRGDILASGSEDQTIRLWDAVTGSCLHTLLGHTGWVRSVAFSPDGNTLASSGEDQTVRLWEVNTGNCISVLRGHSHRIRSVTFSPSGDVLTSGSDDGLIICWNVLTFEPFQFLRNERPYEGMNIAHVKGLTEAQIASLKTLGAIDLPDEF